MYQYFISHHYLRENKKLDVVNKHMNNILVLMRIGLLLLEACSLSIEIIPPINLVKVNSMIGNGKQVSTV